MGQTTDAQPYQSSIQGNWDLPLGALEPQRLAWRQKHYTSCRVRGVRAATFTTAEGAGYEDKYVGQHWSRGTAVSPIIATRVL